MDEIVFIVLTSLKVLTIISLGASLVFFSSIIETALLNHISCAFFPLIGKRKYYLIIQPSFVILSLTKQDIPEH